MAPKRSTQLVESTGRPCRLGAPVSSKLGPASLNMIDATRLVTNCGMTYAISRDPSSRRRTIATLCKPRTEPPILPLGRSIGTPSEPTARLDLRRPSNGSHSVRARCVLTRCAKPLRTSIWDTGRQALCCSSSCNRRTCSPTSAYLWASATASARNRTAPSKRWPSFERQLRASRSVHGPDTGQSHDDRRTNDRLREERRDHEQREDELAGRPEVAIGQPPKTRPQRPCPAPIAAEYRSPPPDRL